MKYFITPEPQRMDPCEFWEYLQQFLPCEPTPTIQEPVPTPTEPITYEPPVMTQPTPIVGFEPVEQSIDKVYYYHSDHLNSSTYVTDDIGRPVAYYDYLPFGEVAVEHNQTTNFNNGYKFNGKELDTATGMYYYGARYYDPRLSVFISIDPLVEQTFEPYSYVGNNPINFIDPTGMSKEGVGDGKPYQGGIRVYQAAESSGDVPGGFSKSSEAFNVGNYRVLPNYITNDSGKEELSHYTASIDVSVITASGKQITPRVDYVFGKNDLSTFKDNVSTFESAANLLFSGGLELSKGQINILNGSGYGRYIREQFASPSNWLAGLSSLALFTRPSPNLPAIYMGDQGKHIVGHNNYINGRSILSANPQTLIDGLNSGKHSVMRAYQNKIIVDFGRNIGTYYQNGKAIGPTRYGTVHYGKKGSHIVPANPQQY